METEISNSISSFFVAFIGIMGLNTTIMFFAYLLGQVIGNLFE